MKGAIKDAAGNVTGNQSLEDKGERENQAGKDRQKRNDAVESASSVVGAARAAPIRITPYSRQPLKPRCAVSA